MVQVACRWTPRLIPLLLSLLLGACASAPPAQRDHFYRLDPPTDVTTGTGPPLSATLRVSDLAARGFLGGRQIVFRTQAQPLETRRYVQYLWEEPPGQALASALVKALRAANLFRFVTGPGQDARAQYLLSGKIIRFEHLPTAQPPRAALAFTLLLAQADSRAPILEREYEGREPVSGDTPDAMAQAFNRLAGRLIGKAVDDLRALRPRLRAAGG